jgi:hypothetical protein
VVEFIEHLNLAVIAREHREVNEQPDVVVHFGIPPLVEV